ncbi:hypothetical protein NDU88_006154 [Pleurodeles waltl]|uniref:SAM domain-containing protein n=1 Tax=Pleurodeles waltl TaxID=8319 RepID=A0AAV7NQZ8_PLEWA|nr:hypothetical protein NDU88_006154 [Pleurodeles waltl]
MPSVPVGSRLGVRRQTERIRAEDQGEQGEAKRGSGRWFTRRDKVPLASQPSQLSEIPRRVKYCTVKHDPPLIKLSDSRVTVPSTEMVAILSNSNTTQGGSQRPENSIVTPNQSTSSCSGSLVEIVANPSSIPRSSVPVKQEQDQATGTVQSRPVEANVPLASSLDALPKKDWPVFGEAGASWQVLLTPMDIMSMAIYYQADKQETEVDLLRILGVHIVSTDKKLQGLNDLIRRAQKHSYTQKVCCKCFPSGDNSFKTIKLLN